MTVIYTTSFQEERLDEDRWNRFFSCRFRFYFYFFFFFRRSFVSSLNDAPGWCQKQVKTVKLNTLLVLSLLMPQIVNHKKREVKATHKHTHTHPHSHRRFQWNQRSKIEQKQGSTFLAGFDRCLLRFFPSYSTLFFYLRSTVFTHISIGCRVMLSTAGEHKQNETEDCLWNLLHIIMLSDTCDGGTRNAISAISTQRRRGARREECVRCAFITPRHFSFI